MVLAGVTKVGATTQIFTGQNTYTGATTVRGGTLVAGGMGTTGNVAVVSSSTSSSTVTLASATLPSGFGVGSVILGQTVQSISGTTVVLSGDANTAVSSSSPVGFNTAQGITNFGTGSVNLQGGTLAFTPTSPTTYAAYGASGVAGQNTITVNPQDPNLPQFGVGDGANQYGSITNGTTITGISTVITYSPTDTTTPTGTTTTISLSAPNTGQVYGVNVVLAPTPTAVSETIASGAGSQLTYSGGSAISLNKNGNTSLTVTAGDAGATGSVLNRVDRGTLVIEPSVVNGVPSADLGSGENLFVNGTAPTVTNGNGRRLHCWL